MSYYVPIVLENTGRGERSMDIYSRLLKDRIIFIGTPIDDMVANLVIAQMFFLQMEDPKKDIQLYINSPGGVVTGGSGTSPNTSGPTRSPSDSSSASSAPCGLPFAAIGLLAK